jgi:hypothetical protein
VIASAKPGALIGCGEQRLDFRTREKVNQGPRETLAGDGEHALNLGRMRRSFEGGIPKEGVDGSQPQIPAADAQSSMLLQVIEKRHD